MREEIITMFIVFCIAIFITGGVAGALSDKSQCSRIGEYRLAYVVPTYKLGCWLTEPAGGK